MKIHNPGNLHPIDSLYAYVSCDESGNEGIIAGAIGNQHYPLVFAGKEMALRTMTTAQTVCDAANVDVRLVRFDRSQVIEQLKPSSKRPRS